MKNNTSLKFLLQFLGMLPLFAVIGCTHPNNIAPMMDTISKERLVKTDNFAGFDTEDVEKTIAVARLANEINAPVSLKDSKTGKIVGVLEPFSPHKVLLKNAGGNIILKLELSGSSCTVWDTEGNRYEGTGVGTGSCDFLPTNAVKSVRIEEEDIKELGIHKEGGTLLNYTVFLATPTTDRERLHEIAMHYIKQFGIDLDHEGRKNSLEIYFYPTADALPRNEFCQLLHYGASGDVSRVLN